MSSTVNIVPRADNEGKLGTASKQWIEVNAYNFKKNGKELATLEDIYPDTAGINLLKRNRVYAVGDIAYSPNLPSWARLECVTAGTTAATEPSWLGVGQYVNDDKVKWIVRDIRDGTPVGRPVTDTILRYSYIKRNGALVKRSDYPTLVKYIQDNPSEVTTEEAWAAGNRHLWTLGDGSTTIRVPNDWGLYEQLSDDIGIVTAGLPNLTGNVLIGEGVAQIATFGHTGIFNKTGDYPGLRFATGSSGSSTGGISFNAQTGNAIYGNSTTVTPPSVKRISQMKY